MSDETRRPIGTAPKDGTVIRIYAPPRAQWPAVEIESHWHKGHWWDWGCPDDPTHWSPIVPASSSESHSIKRRG